MDVGNLSAGPGESRAHATTAAPPPRQMRAWTRRRVVVPAISCVTLLGVGLPLWTSARSSGAAPAFTRRAAAVQAAPARAPVLAPLAPLSPRIEPASAADPSAPTAISRWEAERALLKRKLLAWEGGRGHRRRDLANHRSGDRHAAEDRAGHGRRERAEAPLVPAALSPGAPAGGETDARLQAAGSGGGSISRSLVNGVVWSHAAEVRDCFSRAVMEHADLHGRLIVRATVDANGRVASLSPTTSIENAGRLQACVVSAFRSWTFPAPSGGSTAQISYAFVFE